MCRNEVDVQLGNSCKLKSDDIFSEDIAVCNKIGYGSAASTSIVLLASIIHPITMAGRVALFTLSAIAGAGGGAGVFHASGPCRDTANFTRSENYKYCDSAVSKFQKEICNF